MFKDFDRRLTREIKRSVDDRLRITEELSNHKVCLQCFFKLKPKERCFSSY